MESKNLEKTKLCLASYNCAGLSQAKTDFIRNVCFKQLKCNICFLQEHWLHRTELSKLSIGGKFEYYGSSGMSDSEILRGRPYGGTGILWTKQLSKCIKPLECDCKRITAIEVKLSNIVICLVNVYMPTDQFNARVDEEFEDTLNYLNAIAAQYSFVIIGGDLNCDLSRNTAQVAMLKKYVYDNNLEFAINTNNAAVDYTCHNRGFNTFSTIDHYIFSFLNEC